MLHGNSGGRWNISQRLIDDITSAFQSIDTNNYLIAKFFSWTQKLKVTKDAFADELQVLVCKIIACKPSFRTEVNKAFKHQCAYHLHNPNYVAIARCQLKGSPEIETFIKFYGQLAVFLGEWNTYSKIGTSISEVENSVTPGNAKKRATKKWPASKLSPPPKSNWMVGGRDKYHACEVRKD